MESNEDQHKVNFAIIIISFLLLMPLFVFSAQPKGRHPVARIRVCFQLFLHLIVFLFVFALALCFFCVFSSQFKELSPPSTPPCVFVSSVRSSNSHPDLLVIQQQQHPTFSDTHRSSIMDFHFLSHYSYIKGNLWTHMLASCIPYWYNRTSLQDSAIQCKIVQDSERCRMQNVSFPSHVVQNSGLSSPFLA